VANGLVKETPFYSLTDSRRKIHLLELNSYDYGKQLQFTLTVVYILGRLTHAKSSSQATISLD
jgi:hypothetical protein